MKKTILAVLTLLFVLLFAFPTSADALETDTYVPKTRASTYVLDVEIYGTYDYAEAHDILKLVNKERKKEGLSTLTLDPTLTEMAMQRAAECAVYYDHTRPDGTSCFTIVQENPDYYYGAFGENIAAGQKSAAEVMEDWINSPGHYANIIHTDFSSIGIGCFYQDDGTMYWTQLFHSEKINTSATPKSPAQKKHIPISVHSNYLSLSMEGLQDCEMNLYSGCTYSSRLFLENTAISWTKPIFLSGGYELDSANASVLTTKGTTFTAVRKGSTELEIQFSTGYFPIEFCVRERLELTSLGDNTIACNQRLRSNDLFTPHLVGIEEGDYMWYQLYFNGDSIYEGPSLLPGQSFTYVIGYYDPVNGWVEASNRITVADTVTAPKVCVGNVASTGKIKLSWDTVGGAVKYKVYRSTSKNSGYKLLTTTTKTSIVNNKVDAGTTYYYYVVAVGADGTVSEKSNKVSRTCDLARPKIELSNISKTGKIKVSWEKIEGAEKYEVYRATSKDGKYTKLITTKGTSITNTSTTAGKTYYYKVKALHSRSAANSGYSEIKSRTCDLKRPDIEVERNKKGKPVVSWEKVSGAKSYKVYIYDANGNQIKTVTTSKLSVTHSSALKNRTYSYRVVAIHARSSANSAKSLSVKVKSR